MADKQIGKVIHFYDKISVAVLSLSENLKTDDRIKFVKDNQEFIQQVSSMQLDHKPVSAAKKGEEVAIKVDQPVKKGAKVYKV
jgi:translation initiation factor IF-2